MKYQGGDDGDSDDCVSLLFMVKLSSLLNWCDKQAHSMVREKNGMEWKGENEDEDETRV